MTFILGIAQTCHPVDGDVVALVRAYARKAKAAGAQLLVFPESLMSVYEKEREAFVNESQPVDGPFPAAMNAIAREEGLWLVYTMNERADNGGLPFNTAIITDDMGTVRGIYRKTHLFDTDFTQESSRMQASDALFQPIDTPFGRLGLAICYDLRFPEVARVEALDGCQVMIYPAAWADGKVKAHQWRTLLAARAIENGMFVVGVSRADAGYIGQSCVVDPRGTIIAQAGPDEQLLTCTIDTDLIAQVRAINPTLDHRRPALYGTR